MMLLSSRTRFLHVWSHVLDKMHHLRMRSLSTGLLRDDCVALMRATAQSVSVVTAMHPSNLPAPEPLYRGATLSSFTTVSMHPYPIVAFSLRKPSRMADLLLRSADVQKSKPHMVINLLSASQARTALQFSRPHVYRDPFSSVSYFPSREGIPILRGCLGALSCTVITSWPLDDSSGSLSKANGEEISESTGEQGSELFLARVLRVEEDSCHVEEQDAKDSELPLVYFRQQYVTVDAAKPLLPLDTFDASNTNSTL